MRNRDSLEITPYGILHKITSKNVYKNYSYIILGKSGPTGKTWLANKLKEFGFNVMELSEFIGELVQYNDDSNHIRFDQLDNVVIIVLNKRLERKSKKRITIILDNEVNSINITTNIKDGIGELAEQSRHLLSDIEAGDVFDLSD